MVDDKGARRPAHRGGRGQRDSRGGSPGAPCQLASTTAAALLAALRRAADPATAASSSAYFKGAVPFIGVRKPGVEAAFRAEVVPRAQPAPAALALARQCLADPHHEMKHCGVLALHFSRRLIGVQPAYRRAALELVDEALRGGDAADWATVDLLATRVVAPLVDADAAALAPELERWGADARCPWAQRAAAVAFVPLLRTARSDARAGAHADAALRVCDAVVRACGTGAGARFPQLGAGWCVREVYARRPALALGWLRERLALLSAEGLRYALEKVADPAERAELMRARRAAAGAAAEPADEQQAGAGGAAEAAPADVSAGGTVVAGRKRRRLSQAL